MKRTLQEQLDALGRLEAKTGLPLADTPIDSAVVGDPSRGNSRNAASILPIPLSNINLNPLPAFTPPGNEPPFESQANLDPAARLRHQLSVCVREWEATVQRLMDTLDRPKMKTVSAELETWTTENEMHLQAEEIARCYVLLARIEIVFEMDEQTGD
jgi:hypothetical protein